MTGSSRHTVKDKGIVAQLQKKSSRAAADDCEVSQTVTDYFADEEALIEFVVGVVRRPTVVRARPGAVRDLGRAALASRPTP